MMSKAISRAFLYTFLTSWAAIGGSSYAAQTTTSKCTVDGPSGSNLKSMVPATGQVPLSELKMTVNNTSSASRKALIHLAADAGVETNAEMRLVFKLDAAASKYYGPQNLANATQFWQTRSSLASILIPPGVHTITPLVFVQGPDGSRGFVDDRCIFVTF